MARGNVIDLAVGVIIGGAFQKIVTSLVNDVVLPLFAPLLDSTDFAEWRIAGVHVGSFVSVVLDFIIIAFFIFLFVRFVNRFKEKREVPPPPLTKQEELLTEIRDLLKKRS